MLHGGVPVGQKREYECLVSSLTQRGEKKWFAQVSRNSLTIAKDNNNKKNMSGTYTQTILDFFTNKTNASHS